MVERIIVGLLHTNAYIFSTGKKECIVIDPGGDPEKIIRSLAVLNMMPKGIVLTHGHLDHTSGAGKLQKHYASLGETVPVAIHEDDATFIGAFAEKVNREQFAFLGSSQDEVFEQLYQPLPEADILLKDNDFPFETDLQVIHTPGHTRGSICLYSESQGLLFTGDTVFFKGVGRSDLPGGSEEQLLTSISKRIFTLPPETRIFPGHGPNTVLEREINHNPYMP